MSEPLQINPDFVLYDDDDDNNNNNNNNNNNDNRGWPNHVLAGETRLNGKLVEFSGSLEVCRGHFGVALRPSGGPRPAI
jgi:hypothetical protein